MNSLSPICIGLGAHEAAHLRQELIARMGDKLPPCVIIFEGPPKPPELPPETIQELSAQLTPPMPFFCKEPRYERSHPNQPFYRNLPRYRRR